MDDLQEINKELADGIMEEKAGANDEAEEVPWPFWSHWPTLVAVAEKAEASHVFLFFSQPGDSYLVAIV